MSRPKHTEPAEFFCAGARQILDHVAGFELMAALRQGFAPTRGPRARNQFELSTLFQPVLTDLAALGSWVGWQFTPIALGSKNCWMILRPFGAVFIIEERPVAVTARESHGCECWQEFYFIEYSDLGIAVGGLRPLVDSVIFGGVLSYSDSESEPTPKFTIVDAVTADLLPPSARATWFWWPVLMLMSAIVESKSIKFEVAKYKPLIEFYSAAPSGRFYLLNSAQSRRRILVHSRRFT